MLPLALNPQRGGQGAPDDLVLLAQGYFLARQAVSPAS